MDSSSEEKRKLHQKELAVALNEAAKQRLAEQSSGKQAQKIRKSNVSYKNRNQMPQEREVKDLKIYVGMLIVSITKVYPVPQKNMADLFMYEVS